MFFVRFKFSVVALKCASLAIANVCFLPFFVLVKPFVTAIDFSSDEAYIEYKRSSKCAIVMGIRLKTTANNRRMQRNKKKKKKTKK